MFKKALPASLLCLVLSLTVLAGDTNNPGNEEPPPPPQETSQAAPASDALAEVVMAVVTALTSTF